MLLPKTAFQDAILPPFIVKKEGEYTEEGIYSLHLFSKVVLDKDEKSGTYVKKFRFLPLRYDGEYARFRSRNDAIQFARYRLGLD